MYISCLLDFKEICKFLLQIVEEKGLHRRDVGKIISLLVFVKPTKEILFLITILFTTTDVKFGWENNKSDRI